MTLYQTLPEASLVFCPVQDARLFAVADEFPIAIGFVGAILMVTRFASLGRKLLIAAVLLLVICGLSPLGNCLLYPLEARFPPWDAARGAPDGIIVLGGSIDPDLSVAHICRWCAARRTAIIVAAALARRYPNARVVFSGGSANLVSNDAREADFAGAIFESLGVDKSRLIMERARATPRRMPNSPRRWSSRRTANDGCW